MKRIFIAGKISNEEYEKLASSFNDSYHNVSVIQQLFEDKQDDIDFSNACNLNLNNIVKSDIVIFNTKDIAQDKDICILCGFAIALGNVNIILYGEGVELPHILDYFRFRTESDLDDVVYYIKRYILN